MSTRAESVAAAVEDVGARVAASGLGGLDGLHVIQGGELLVARHWTPDVRRDVYSVSKSVVALAVGIAVAEGRLARSDRLLDHLDRFVTIAADGVELVTVDQLLRMTSGIVYRWEDDEIAGVDDPAVAVLRSPLGFAPGTGFAYRGGSSYLLSRIVQAATGTDVVDYLQPRLFGPLGIAAPVWERCPSGYTIGAVGLHLRTGEIARVAQLLLQDGRWQDRPLVPSDYVAALTEDPVDTAGHSPFPTSGAEESTAYGRGVWLCRRDGAWRMDGLYGQFGIVLPSLHACIAVTAHHRGPTEAILDAIWSTVVPVLR